VRTASLNRLGEKRLELPTGSPEEAASATLPSEPDVDSKAITAHLKAVAGRDRDKIRHCHPSK